MERDRKEILRQLLRRAAQKECFSEALAQAAGSYQIKPYNILKLSPSKINQIYHNIKAKFYDTNLTNQFDSWYENQLRVFIWVLVVYSFLESKSIESMGDEDWKYFSNIFNAKNPDTFQFQALCLIKRRKSKKWNAQEIKMLVSIIGSKTEKNKWNEIAKAMFTRSKKRFFRTPKQCREQWINHLDPSKVRSQWTTLEDYEMIKAIIAVGKKWSLVARELENKRTQHMVKNRFKSLLNTEIKRIDYEEKEDVLILKIKQRLEANSAVKKHLQRNSIIDRSSTHKNQETKRNKKSSSSSEQENGSQQEDEQYCPFENLNSPKSIQPIKVNPLPNEQLEEEEELIQGEVSMQNISEHSDNNKDQQAWAWKGQCVDEIHHLNKMFLVKEELNHQEQFNNFFAPIKKSPFKFDF